MREFEGRFDEVEDQYILKESFNLRLLIFGSKLVDCDLLVGCELRFKINFS